MNNKYNLTEGSIPKTLAVFAIPYLISCFMQTFYGMADLFIVGLYNGAETTTAVSVGSQFTHMITVIIIGLAMGTTVRIANSVGAGDKKKISRLIGTSTVFFAALSIVLIIGLVGLTNPIVTVMRTPVEAVSETASYLRICFIGMPFIVAYNLLSSIYRGAGDSRRPMYFIGIACALNLVLDFVFIGGFNMGASGAAYGTIIAQLFSSLVAAFSLKKANLGFELHKEDFRLDTDALKDILGVGVPVALQDGVIQISFLLITIIANSRGLIAAASVGITEKLISFFFLVPSALLSAISAITAQNIGAGKNKRADATLFYGMGFSVTYGLICFVLCQFIPEGLLSLFSRDAAVVTAGARYLMSYSVDIAIASIHFCFSGYFMGRGKSTISFIHNILSVIIFRVPGAYLASLFWPDDLFPMGLAAPAGSLFSAFICLGFFIYLKKKDARMTINAL